MTRCLICGHRIDDVETAFEVRLENTDGVKAYVCQKCDDDLTRGAMPCRQPHRFTFRVH